jgi:hypothetical protein
MPVRSAAVVACLAAALFAPPASAFCGFFVGKADSGLFNEASKVVLARDGERTTITMANDYRGSPRSFALVVPVPEVLRREQIRVVDAAVIQRVDAWSAPRLAEYHDPDPCADRPASVELLSRKMMASADARGAGATRPIGVRVEAQYTVGEYDIVLLSAEQSDGLETWLRTNGYRIPAGAAKALAPYIRQQQKFFVARVNLGEHAKTGLVHLRPLQFSFQSPRFMLPIRLGMVNASGPQDLVVFMLTRQGRVETTNYRTVKLPADVDLPVWVKSDPEQGFGAFYKALFDTQAKREGHRVVFTEYFWDMGWCDPCAADPLSNDELRALGAAWITAPDAAGRVATGPQQALLTRLHVRYTPQTFPEDLMFQETKDRANYQTRYVLRHAWSGNPDACPAAKAYLQAVDRRRETEAQRLASLTGWNIERIRAKTHRSVPGVIAPGTGP